MISTDIRHGGRRVTRPLGSVRHRLIDEPVNATCSAIERRPVEPDASSTAAGDARRRLERDEEELRAVYRYE